MYLFDLKQKFTSKHPVPFTKAAGYFKSSFVTKMLGLYVMKYACLSFYHNRNPILPTESDLWVFNLIYSVVKIHQYSVWRNRNTRLMSYDCETEAHTRRKSVLALTQFLLQLGRQKYDSEPWTLRQSSVSCCYTVLLHNIASFEVQLKIWSPVTVRSFQFKKALVHTSYLNKKLMISCSRTMSIMKTQCLNCKEW